MVYNSVMAAYWKALSWNIRGKSKIFFRQEDSPDEIRTKVLYITVLNLQHSQFITVLFSLFRNSLYTMLLTVTIKFFDHQFPNHRTSSVTFALGKNQAGIFRSLCLTRMKAGLPKIGILGTRLTSSFFQCNVNMTQCT
jgi:hypothetical protein